MKYVFTLLAIVTVVLAQAQANAPQWNYGVKGDLNFSHIQGNGMAGGNTLGAQAGVFIERTFNSKWSVQPELLFSQNNSKKGDDFIKFYNTNGNQYAAKDIKLGYISLPVMFKYNINKSFAFLAGPQYSYLIVDAESLVPGTTDGKGKAFKKSELSGNVGGQFTVGRVALYGRYNLGFSNINNIDERYKWKSSHIQAGIAIRLN